MARQRKQAPGAPTGAQGGGGNTTFGYREPIIETIDNQVQNLDADRVSLMAARGNLTQGMGRGGTAGGVRMQRGTSTGGAGGDGGGGGVVSNPVWITQLLGQYAKGLTAEEIREYAIEAGRKVHASYPHDSFTKLRASGLVRKMGEGKTARYCLTRLGIARMERAGTANLPEVGKQKKGSGKAMSMTG